MKITAEMRDYVKREVYKAVEMKSKTELPRINRKYRADINVIKAINKKRIEFDNECNNKRKEIKEKLKNIENCVFFYDEYQNSFKMSYSGIEELAIKVLLRLEYEAESIDEISGIIEVVLNSEIIR